MGRQFMPPFDEDNAMAPGRDERSESGGAAGCVAVPVNELRKLEQARVDLYEYLGNHLGERVLLGLVDITGQIWRVANRKKWD